MFLYLNRSNSNPGNKRGISLVEILTVLAIVGIGSGLFYSVFYVNWIAFEKELALADLQLEADEIMEAVAIDVRYSVDFIVAEGGKEVAIQLPQDVIVTYTVTEAGEVSRTKDETTKIFSPRADYDASIFTDIGNYLAFDLTLFDTIAGHRLALSVSTQAYPRNSP